MNRDNEIYYTVITNNYPWEYIIKTNKIVVGIIINDNLVLMAVCWWEDRML